MCADKKVKPFSSGEFEALLLSEVERFRTLITAELIYLRGESLETRGSDLSKVSECFALPLSTEPFTCHKCAPSRIEVLFQRHISSIHKRVGRTIHRLIFTRWGVE